MTTALYRRHRPETFQDVIGQSHVTDPLMTALRKNKVNHAYLFSGPRGCGKTTSARILARCLNCVEGPTPTPCGRCESCVDLSRDGAGSLDVIEMDAASHGGVDDARQLRERATFAPVRDRYKIFIIDEAHMVTRDGFNALLKIVEEPPEHIKFIFATTEPNKVLPTIRSRTHHYPFRLVPPEPLMDYLQQLSDQESVGVEPGVMAMVVRAGGGSVRDSLSVLDQLMAGTDTDSVTYNLAVSLLGYTHGALLDDVVDAFASGDSATVFRAVDRVIQTGQDPRRFVEDLLERFRDLVIVDAVPESAANILHGMPEDQVARLRNQAQLMGAAELSRAADITNEALTEMTGATSPQLHLELLCARLLLPSAENSTRGAGARIDRLERRLNMGRTGAPTGPLVGVDTASPSPNDDAPAATERAHSPQTSAPSPSATADAASRSAQEQSANDLRATERALPAERKSGTSPGAQSGAEEPELQESAASSTPTPDAVSESVPPRGEAAQQEAPAPHADPATAQGPSSGGGIDMIRGSWTEIVNTLADIHRVSWMTVMRATPVAFDGSVLQVVFDAAGDRKNFPRFEPNLVAAIQQVLGVSCRVEAVGPGEGGSHRPAGGAPGPAGGVSGPATGSSGPGGGSRPTGGVPGPTAGGSGPASSGSGPAAGHPGTAGTPQGSAEPTSSNDRTRRTGTSSHAGDQTPSADTDSAPVNTWAVAQIPTGDEHQEDAPSSPDQGDAPEESPANAGPSVGADGSASSPQTVEKQPTPPSEHTDAAPRTRTHANTSGNYTDSANSGPVSSGVGTGSSRPDPTASGSEPTASTSAPTASGPDSTAANEVTDRGQPRQSSPRHPSATSTWERTDSSTPPDSPEPPASPYDDIPWPDEPPPEDEPPFADTYGQGRPSRAAAHSAPTTRHELPTAPPPLGTPRSTGTPSSVNATATITSEADAPAQPTATATATEDELPPEQWRPSSSSNGNGSAPATAAKPAPSAPPRKPSFRERHAAQIAAARADSATKPPARGAEASPDEDFVPSDDDVAVENSGLQGRAMIEKILGGRLVEERPHQSLL
ncbi:MULTISPECIES: DNA polymerase III subunit gamma and tau [Kocuria]|uniref:DNA polymerase III subunit gamma/tau n=1 Tax=Kocuria subflava TaxID=1736139 RepID=A0A846TNU6_9MICC|nr:DNA polymerase III subunit gamma and tau [Kocuria sp. CPCC 104605]NKE08479.1 DNA polymerase III subunit gamma and tau [Kocuria subflava]